MKRIVGALLVVLALGCTESASAFDGQRQGFLLGFGVGAGSYKIEDRDSKAGLVTDLKIGYGFTDQFQLFYTNKVTWRSADDWDGDGLILHGLTGIGANYYFRPAAPSFFVGGGLGLASHGFISTDSDVDSESDSGFGFYLGGGFEFARHLNVEFSVLWDTIDYGYDDASAWTYMVTLNALAF
jgi:hypothetical protein